MYVIFILVQFVIGTPPTAANVGNRIRSQSNPLHDASVAENEIRSQNEHQTSPSAKYSVSPSLNLRKQLTDGMYLFKLNFTIFR